MVNMRPMEPEKVDSSGISLWKSKAVLSCAILLAIAALATLSYAAKATSKSQDTVWGLAGGYAGINLSNAYQRGVRAVLLEVNWALAEPGPERFDETYLRQLKAEAQRYRSIGFQISLNYGLDAAPGWLMRYQGARYVNQYGASYTADPLPDLIFNRRLRPFAQEYTEKILHLLGPFAYMVRVGGGFEGELDYPPSMDGPQVNQYWAYGSAAQKSAPMPGWRPCSSQQPGGARSFLAWYLESLADYQRWQIQTVRSVYRGQIAILYPSVGFTAAQENEALKDDLCGRTPIEKTGAFARGWDQIQQVGDLSGSGLVVYSTWADNPVAMDRLGELASLHHLRLAGENAGLNGPADMNRAVAAARAWHFISFFWVRAQQAYCECNGWATIGDYQHDIEG